MEWCGILLVCAWFLMENPAQCLETSYYKIEHKMGLNTNYTMIGETRAKSIMECVLSCNQRPCCMSVFASKESGNHLYQCTLYDVHFEISFLTIKSDSHYIKRMNVSGNNFAP